MLYGARERQWFYKIGKKTLGPVDDKEITSQISQGKILPKTKVWHPDLGPVWKRASEIPDLKGYIETATPTFDKPKEAEPVFIISNTVVWLMVITPLLCAAITLLVGSAVNPALPEFNSVLLPMNYLLSLPFISALFYRLDRKALRNVFEKSVPLGYLTFCLIPPIFFLLRARVDAAQSPMVPFLSLLFYPAPLVLFLLMN
ncbi:DUF4339 domain-containing protein [Flexibacterium corallicola]|uniref:DUF4339 domain-containing protein n=1 Tax=Flexibacterium corallicola TaxID=3037259 RepID=UPI00286EDB28|nr:DUF4339 domain-containing protein [Pseudovibrio sp. M1P-2-3]